MKTYLTISELMERLKIRQSEYKTFRAWCYKNKDKLDTQDCKHNHGYYTYNVKLVSELYRKKHAATSPVEAAETLATALSTATGRNVTGSDVLAAYERGKDYIRMRRTMARTLLRMRKAQRMHKMYCNWNLDIGQSYLKQHKTEYETECKTMLRTMVLSIISIILSVISLLIHLL